MIQKKLRTCKQRPFEMTNGSLAAVLAVVQIRTRLAQLVSFRQTTQNN